MKFIRQYLKIITYSLMGLTFGFAFFYLLVNGYHYLELRKDYYAYFDQLPVITSLEEKLQNTRNNISGFSSSNYKGTVPVSQMIRVQKSINNCLASFDNETYRGLFTKGNKVSIIDVYNLRESYENNILNDCIITNLYWLTSLEENEVKDKTLLANQELIKLYVSTLLDETSYLKKDLLNNSSYFFNTSIATMSMKNNTKDGFYEVINSYNETASFLEYLSSWFKSTSRGGK